MCLLCPTISRKLFFFLRSLLNDGLRNPKEPPSTNNCWEVYLSHQPPPPPTSADFVSDLVSGLLHSLADAQLFLRYRPIWQGDVGVQAPCLGHERQILGVTLGPLQPQLPAFLSVIWPFRREEAYTFSSCKFNSMCAPSQRGKKRARTN